MKVIMDRSKRMENKYNCDAYDSGYCYCLARPLTDEEDDKCEDKCCAYDKKKNMTVKSCPFCGEKPRITVNLSRMYTISCENKDCFIQPQTKSCTKSKEELIGIWNYRIDTND